MLAKLATLLANQSGFHFSEASIASQLFLFYDSELESQDEKGKLCRNTIISCRPFYDVPRSLRESIEDNAKLKRVEASPKQRAPSFKESPIAYSS